MLSIHRRTIGRRFTLSVSRFGRPGNTHFDMSPASRVCVDNFVIKISATLGVHEMHACEQSLSDRLLGFFASVKPRITCSLVGLMRLKAAYV
ncbi:hypothetical protein ACHAWU_009929 [Discostella pseudostelligera]|uniref:Uncharacterized protein n=1 Tax=Discostella pseudostelligera TaxID=259834 RepID=A0ABD3LXS2_9STRA